jgi:hypothetical protein
MEVSSQLDAPAVEEKNHSYTLDRMLDGASVGLDVLVLKEMSSSFGNQTPVFQDVSVLAELSRLPVWNGRPT